MFNLLRTVLRCRHDDAVREHRDDGWYWVCSSCGQSALLNPRDRAEPKPIGRYDERKAVAGKARAEKAALQRRAVAARLSEGTPTPSHKVAAASRTNVLELRRVR
jgi:hypothetical protein